MLKSPRMMINLSIEQRPEKYLLGKYLRYILTIFCYLSILMVDALVAAPVKNKVAFIEEPSRINKVKSAYLYNFLKYVTFSDEKIDTSPENYFVCVLGVDPFGSQLELMNGRIAKGKKVAIKRMLSVEKASHCHLVYVSRSKQLELEPVLEILRQSSVLTVSDIPEFTQKGGIIRFINKNDNIKLEINLKEAQKAQIKISALLLEIASIVE
ncbi:YfiR family protein [Aliikangiella sp. G2MR2-5]|uniref:YfiR family protein n=1 Tax=Aliikangiella sp. G2MR2-5 TaxID=2788943 RepID=UPI0018AADEA5|nr:YfiR family protein [Aliikangiella sp. G2MR2-5]